MILKYKDGYKYQLVEEFNLNLQGFFDDDFFSLVLGDYIRIYNSILFVAKGYAWDGGTGAVDTKLLMIPTLVHDVLYQLMRNDKLPQTYREKADKLLKDMYIESARKHGSWIQKKLAVVRAQYIYLAVRIAGKKFSTSDNKKKILTAP